MKANLNKKNSFSKENIQKNNYFNNILNYFFENEIINVLPMILLLAFVPLIVYLRIIPLEGINYEAWPVSGQNVDFFSFYKSRWIIGLGFFAVTMLLYNAKFKQMFYTIPASIYLFFIIISTFLSKIKLSNFSPEYAKILSNLNYNPVAVRGVADRYEGVFVLCAYIFLMFAAIHLIENKAQIKFVVFSFFFSTLIVGLIGIFQYLGYDFFRSNFGRGIILPESQSFKGNIIYPKTELFDKLEFKFGKYTIYSTLYNTNFVGSFMVMALFTSIAFLYYTGTIFKIPMLLFTYLIFANQLGCRSRAGFMGVIFSGLVFLILMRKEIIKQYQVSIALFIGFLLIMLGMNKFDSTNLSRPMFNFDVERINKLKYIKVITEDKSELLINYDDTPIKVKYKNGKIEFFDLKDNKINMIVKENQLILENDTYKNLYRFEIGKKAFNQGNNQVHIPTFLIKMDMRMKKDEAGNIIGKEYPQITFEFLIYQGQFKIVGSRGRIDDLRDVEKSDFLDGKERYGSSRIYIWSRSIPLLKHFIFVWAGPDTYSLVYPQYDYVGKVIGWNTPNIIVDKPHNLYLQIAINTGMISLIAFLVLIFYYFIQSFLLYLNTEYDFYTLMGIGFFLASLGYCVSGFFNDSLVSVAPIFWIILGMGIAVNHKIIEHRKTKQTFETN